MKKDKTYRKKIADNLRICRGCPSMRRVRFLGMTCGNFLNVPEKIKDTCGCLIEVKTLVHFISSCPQNKW